ncbi:MAG: sugar phosphate nucleotidyltransferase [Acidobacteriota bacterium]
MSPPRALVLTAGLGTRLRPLTYVRAKAAVPVNGETLARRVVRWLAAQGIRDLVLNLHHLPATIATAVGDGADLGVRVRYSWEVPILGSAGGPRRALPLLVDSPESGSGIPDPDPNGTFILVNGDTLTDVPIDDMLALHGRAGATVTMALIPNPRPDMYGGVVVSEDGWVTGFTRPGTRERSWHFIGVQIAEASAFAALPDGVPAESVNALYPRLIAASPHSVAAFRCAASFQDIGTPADYLQTSLGLAAREGDRMRSGGRQQIDDSAHLVRTAVWDDVTIGKRADLVECIVGDGVMIPDGARYHRCAIVPAGARRPQDGERIEGALLVTELR